MDILKPKQKIQQDMRAYYNTLDDAGKLDFLINNQIAHTYIKNLKDIDVSEEMLEQRKAEEEFNGILQDEFVEGRTRNGEIDIELAEQRMRLAYQKNFDSILKVGRVMQSLADKNPNFKDDKVVAHYALCSKEAQYSEGMTGNFLRPALDASRDLNKECKKKYGYEWYERATDIEKEELEKFRAGLNAEDRKKFEKSYELLKKKPSIYNGEYSTKSLGLDPKITAAYDSKFKKELYEELGDLKYRNNGINNALNKFNTQRSRVFGRDENGKSRETTEHKTLRELAEKLIKQKERLDKMGPIADAKHNGEYLKMLDEIKTTTEKIKIAGEEYVEKRKGILKTPAGNKRLQGARDIMEEAARISNEVDIEMDRVLANPKNNKSTLSEQIVDAIELNDSKLIKELYGDKVDALDGVFGSKRAEPEEIQKFMYGDDVKSESTEEHHIEGKGKKGTKEINMKDLKNKTEADNETVKNTGRKSSPIGNNEAVKSNDPTKKEMQRKTLSK